MSSKKRDEAETPLFSIISEGILKTSFLVSFHQALCATSARNSRSFPCHRKGLITMNIAFHIIHNCYRQKEKFRPRKISSIITIGTLLTSPPQKKSDKKMD